MFFRRWTCVVACAFLAVSSFLNVLAVAQSAPHDTKYIPEKPLVVVWSHPNEHLANPAFAEFFKFAQGTAPEKAQNVMKDAIPKFDLLRVSVTMPKPLGDHDGPVSVRPIVVSLMHFTDAPAATLMLETITNGMQPVTIPEWKSPIYTFQGHSTTEAPAVPGEQAHTEPKANIMSGRGITQFTPQTIAQTDNVGLMLLVLKPTSAAAEPVWAKDLAELSKTQTTVYLDLTQVREMVKKEAPPPGQGMEAMIFNSVKSLWEQADYVFVSIDTTNGIQISAQAQSADAESAQRFKGALDGIVALGKGFLPSAKQGAAQLNQIQPGLGDTAYTELENVVNSIKITQTGMQTKVTLGVSQETLAKLPAVIEKYISLKQVVPSQSLNPQGPPPQEIPVEQ